MLIQCNYTVMHSRCNSDMGHYKIYTWHQLRDINKIVCKPKPLEYWKWCIILSAAIFLTFCRLTAALFPHCRYPHVMHIYEIHCNIRTIMHKELLYYREYYYATKHWWYLKHEVNDKQFSWQIFPQRIPWHISKCPKFPCFLAKRLPRIQKKRNLLISGVWAEDGTTPLLDVDCSAGV